MLCDSNVLIYAAEPGDTVCLPFVQSSDAVTRIEVLGFQRFHLLPQDRKERLEALVSSSLEVLLDDEITLRAISLRRQKR